MVCQVARQLGLFCGPSPVLCVFGRVPAFARVVCPYCVGCVQRGGCSLGHCPYAIASFTQAVVSSSFCLRAVGAVARLRAWLHALVSLGRKEPAYVYLFVVVVVVYVVVVVLFGV